MTWTEVVVNDEQEAIDLAEELSMCETFALYEGESWLVFWNTDGDEYWMAPPDEDSAVAAPGVGRFVRAEDAAYPFSYVFRDRRTPGPVTNALAAWDAREAVGDALAAATRGGPEVAEDAWLNAEDGLSSAMEELRRSLDGAA